MMIFNGSKYATMMFLAILTASMNVSPMQCKDLQKGETIVHKSSTMLLGWTGLSMASWGAKKITNYCAEKYPIKKELYLKTARVFQRVSRFSMMPLMSLALTASAAGVFSQLQTEYVEQDSTLKDSLSLVMNGTYIPYAVMCDVPAILHTQYVDANALSDSSVSADIKK